MEKQIEMEIAEAKVQLAAIDTQYRKGLITFPELYGKQIDVLKACKDRVFNIAWSEVDAKI